MSKDFNIVIAGVGGQGIITLTRILAEAALLEGHDVKTSELHGLSQRGGSVETHIRFDKEVFSPLNSQAGADLVIALEAQEALKSCFYGSNKKTKFLVNDSIKPILGAGSNPSSKVISQQLKKFAKQVIVVPASKAAKEELGKEVLAGICLLGYMAQKKMSPLKASSILKAIEKVVPSKYLAINKKAFELSL